MLARIIGQGPVPLIGPPEPLTPVCSVCEDRGYVYRNVPPDHPDYGMVRLCDCMVRAMQVERPERIAKHWREVTGVPERLRDLRLETHPNLRGPHNPGLLDRLLAADLERTSWFFWGAFSLGKSGIAAGYAWRYLETTGESVLWRPLPDVLEEVKETYRRQSDDNEDAVTEHGLIQRYTSVGLLVLDDMGAEYLRETGPDSWAADVLYRIIGRRHAALRPTVFTSNITLTEVGKRVGDRIVERIVEMCGRGNVVPVYGDNLRWK